jgi:hypothetical protein
MNLKSIVPWNKEKQSLARWPEDSDPFTQLQRRMNSLLDNFFSRSSAHWAIVRGWAKPHYLHYPGLISPGVVLVYTPRDEAEYEICRTLFSTSYRSAVRRVGSKNFE